MSSPGEPEELDDDLHDGWPDFCPYCQSPRKESGDVEGSVAETTFVLELPTRMTFLFGCVFEPRVHEGGLQFAALCEKAKALGLRRGSFVAS